MPEQPRLLPITLPTGWRVNYHELRDLEPATLAPDSPDWVWFSEDLLQLAHEGGELVVDVGWYPDGRPQGRFSLKVIEGDAWEKPRLSLRLHALSELLVALEAQLCALSEENPVPTDASLVAQLRDLEPSRRAEAAERLVWRGSVEALPAVMDACSRERHRATELRLQEAVEALSRARHAKAGP